MTLDLRTQMWDVELITPDIPNQVGRRPGNGCGIPLDTNTLTGPVNVASRPLEKANIQQWT